MNVYDADKISDLLKSIGFSKADSAEEADFVILNTCHIREKATAKVYSDLGRLRQIKIQRKAEGRDFLIAVAGCTAQAEGEQVIKQAPFVDLVFGPQSYHRIPEMLEQIKRKRGTKVIELEFPVESKFDYLIEPTMNSKISEFLTIQEGCDKFCHFCCVPYTRGPEYSRSVEEVIKEAKILVDKGARELTLLGQNVSAYHGLYQDKEVNMAFLIRKIAEIDGLDRIRYTTSHPRDIDDELIKVHARGDVPKLQPFLHLPVQSGSNTVLKQMNRKHTREFYFDIIDRMREGCPDIGFSSDFIVGYPTETEEDFLHTMELVERVKFGQAYSFAYSVRPGTPAGFLEQIGKDVKMDRLYRLQALLNQQQIDYNNSFLGKTIPVLIEQISRDQKSISGKSPYMQTTHINLSDNIISASDVDKFIGKVIDVKIVETMKNSIVGVIS
jgi:tRNA-2-methylthio-N6-dimethylallyladenosine synthase